MVLEPLDARIVRLLAADGRLSFAELGRQTGLSTSAAHQRVRRLEERGVLVGYSARIDAHRIGLGITAFVSIRPMDPSQPDDSPERVAALDEIISCYSVAGDESYILHVQVASPLDLEDLLARIRAVANVSTRTTMVLSTPFESRPPALPRSEPHG